MKFFLRIEVKIIILLLGISIYYFYIAAIKLLDPPFMDMVFFFLIVGFLDVIIFNLILRNKTIWKSIIIWLLSLFGLLLLEGCLYQIGFIYKYKIYDINNIIYQTFNNKKLTEQSYLLRIDETCMDVIEDGVINKPKFHASGRMGELFDVMNSKNEEISISLTLSKKKDKVEYYFYCINFTKLKK